MKVFKRLGRSIAKRLGRNPGFFLERVRGVIHVGANTGQERDTYDRSGVDVLWIEPIPDVFRTLKTNLEGYPRQQARQGLITDKDGAEYDFHVASNVGQSSSILDFKQHREIWPEVTFTGSLRLRSRTLGSFLQEQGIDVGRYDALVVDTQGAELLVLKGAREILGAFKYIQAEVADFEAYAGCCTIDDLGAFLGASGFKEWLRHKVSSHAGGGSYYEILFRKLPDHEPGWSGLSAWGKAAAYLGEKFRTSRGR